MHLRDVFQKIHSHETGQKVNLVPERSMHHSVIGTYLLLLIMGIYLTNCQKNLTYPSQQKNSTVSDLQIEDFNLSVSSMMLYQDNDNTPALSCNWHVTNDIPGTIYSVEAASYGTNFTNPVALISTETNNASILVKNANQVFCMLVPAGQTDMIELRLKATSENNSIIYSKPQALKVGTYENFIEYKIPQYMHVPGNYQSWDIMDAPHIVTRNNDGEFEGYINFSNTFPQFLLLKDTSWTPVNTYTNIGAGKFGFNGKMFTLSSGAGIYLLRANTNTNNWNTTKINCFGLSGTAVDPVNNADPKMVFDSAGKTWSITTTLQKGSFRIRANNSDTVSFGQSMISGYKVPDYNGSDFVVEQPGIYTVVLNLHFAGDYFCSLIRRSDKYGK